MGKIARRNRGESRETDALRLTGASLRGVSRLVEVENTIDVDFIPFGHART